LYPYSINLHMLRFSFPLALERWRSSMDGFEARRFGPGSNSAPTTNAIIGKVFHGNVS
jgi:hypothetical protein